MSIKPLFILPFLAALCGCALTHYDSLDQKYHIISRMDFSTSCSFPTFSEALYLFVDELF